MRKTKKDKVEQGTAKLVKFHDGKFGVQTDKGYCSASAARNGVYRHDWSYWSRDTQIEEYCHMSREAADRIFIELTTTQAAPIIITEKEVCVEM
jgi:hypothetical protein